MQLKSKRNRICTVIAASSCVVMVKKTPMSFTPNWVNVSDMWCIRSFCRSVIVAPKKSSLAPSISASAAFPAATAASVLSGTAMDSVAVVSSGDASQSTSAEAAAGEDTRLSVKL